ncbi:a8d2b2dd-e72b-420c-977c-74187d2490a8 [Thermothielavioides terrestris]|uniref:CFEM domain-containing protein n=2 Tax=Thermothielavioides terrestris TaxID=2587410 RepID=G2RCU1_THETT|nr:uncharacterized protein THITE_2091336 [Thermothielavioides terrestris NRRL 8126]AEO69829.1 hypothetical protein THITE_2091336 [Thermothielavioides terrestris NRRL 8126]SPQ17627.1 a8d2b2dd-e72b-420c-977c-74187d2490a8 [Thermothielavioides terrestris]
MKCRTVLLIAAAAALILAAPAPKALSLAAQRIVDELPTCAAPAMKDQLNRAPEYGCEHNADGTPNAACLCKNDKFKSDTRNAIRNNCLEMAELETVENWATRQCGKAPKSRPVKRVRFANVSSDDSSSDEGSNTKKETITVAPNEALFDLEEIEDETAAAAITQPVSTIALAAVLVAAFVVL